VPAPIRTENADVAQIMREIRTRIAQRQGITLSDQQVEELAARRLEAVLDVRSISPELLDELRRAAGGRSVDVPTGPQAAGYAFEADTIYETPQGLLRFMRRLLNPLLKLLFNPEPLIMALHQQAQLNAAATAREAERVAQQAEWNALQYALLQRLVSEIAKLSIEGQHLAQQVESLSAKVDFNDRRVRAMEGGIHQVETRSAPAQAPAPRPEGGFIQSAQEGSSVAGTGDGPRRKRRRRRGRRPGSPDQPMGSGAMQPGAGDDAESGEDDSSDDSAFLDGPGQADADSADDAAGGGVSREVFAQPGGHAHGADEAGGGRDAVRPAEASAANATPAAPPSAESRTDHPAQPDPIEP